VLVPFINSLVVLDLEGDRLFAKYYDGRKKAEQIANEALLYKKTKAVAAKSEGSQTVPTCACHETVILRSTSSSFALIQPRFCFSTTRLLSTSLESSASSTSLVLSRRYALSFAKKGRQLFVKSHTRCLLFLPLLSSHCLIQNELILVAVLDCIFDTVSTLLKGQVRTIMYFPVIIVLLLLHSYLFIHLVPASLVAICRWTSARCSTTWS